METSRTILSITQIDAKKEIFKSVLELCQDYTLNIDKPGINFMTDRLYKEISENHKGLTFKYFYKAIREVQTNYTTYRTVNVAVILTALNKVLQ